MCRSLCKDLPSATFQFRERTNWRWLSQDGSIEATILFCRNLDHHKLLQLASFLTSCAVSFRFSSVNTIVINTAGLDSSILVRLMHYAEVPIPTTLKQGAFSLSIKGNGLSTGDRNFLSFDLKIGRIGALPSVPVQIRCLPLHQSTIGRWIKKELSGFNISEVVCVDEDQVTDSFLQFRVPIEDESNYPKVFKYKNKTFSVDHALPYATPIGMRARPPQEESVHDHWKKAARLAPQEKISHVNCVAKTANCPMSLQRVMRLRESSVKESAYTVFMYVEQTKIPWCFFTGSVTQQTALDCYSKFGIHHLESKEEIEAVFESHNDKKHCLNRDVEGSTTIHIVQVCCDDDQPVRMGLFCEGKYGWTVSTAELVQCHAYTPCILVMMVPPGCKLTDVCSPRRHFTTLQVIVLPNPKRSRCEAPGATDSQLTQISPNRTATPVSPEDAERYTQQSLSPIKPSTEAISPTAIWTEVAGEQTTSKEENRQMPLLRRSSDQAINQSDKLPSQDLLEPKDSKVPRKTTATQPERYIRNEDDCNKWPEEDKQSDQMDKGKTKAVIPAEQKGALKGAANERTDAELSPCDDHENGSKPSGKVTSGNLTGKDKSVISKDASLLEDTKTKGNYTNAVCGEGTLIETLSKGIGTDLLESKQNGQQQYVADTRKSHNTLSGCGVQIVDAEMKDIKHNADSRRRGVKKDLVSKSCPPMLRVTSPKMNVKQSESRERNQRALQRATLSKIRDSSQTGKSRNKVAGGDESVILETTCLQDGHGPDSEVTRLTQQMQDLKGVEQVDCHIVDLIAKIEQENAEQKRERLARVTDATQKWCSCLPTAHQERIISLGGKFLRRMDSTLCFLIVVYRMLAKANWTRSMVAVDIKQAALYAISRGWYVKASDFRDYPFTREEFAVSAATYLNKIPADAPEDPFRALYIVISHLPFSRAKLFSKGQVSCPYCLESCEVSFPSFTSRVSWTMANWTDLATCLNSAEPNPWMHSFGWHATECNRSDHIPNVTAFESWTLLELHLHQPSDFPTLIDSQKLTSDPSLGIMNGQILGFVCTNTRDFGDPNMHYWFLKLQEVPSVMFLTP